MLSCTYMYKISKLLASGQKTFHTGDLGVIWGITNKNTLYTTIKRYVAKGILFTIHKGFYSVVPLKDLDPYALGVSFLHRFAYVSTETVLAREGLISQTVYPLTMVSSVSKKFSILDQNYVVRKMVDSRLYQTSGLETVNGVLIATPKRAVSDMLYFSPHYHFDKKL